MEGTKYHRITKNELYMKHLDLWEDISFASKATKVSIKFAINVLEGMQPEHGQPDGFIQSEIDRLKSLLKP